MESLGVDVVIERGEGFAEKVRNEFPDGVDGLRFLMVFVFVLLFCLA